MPHCRLIAQLAQFMTAKGKTHDLCDFWAVLAPDIRTLCQTGLEAPIYVNVLAHGGCGVGTDPCFMPTFKWLSDGLVVLVPRQIWRE
jgi:hypothetical protein